ncbi:hypothetical protein EO769_13610 [Escherichia coli]|uniref:hypothetical protein n=1 Tax=Escherichia coli TaxID=562 RepID=UPI000FDF83EB|nr:hypothetical protein [Escherichia coli]QAA02721.1 hypothetical protein EO769_13610 [Escherichia coli]
MNLLDQAAPVLVSVAPESGTILVSDAVPLKVKVTLEPAAVPRIVTSSPGFPPVIESTVLAAADVHELDTKNGIALPVIDSNNLDGFGSPYICGDPMSGEM